MSFDQSLHALFFPEGESTAAVEERLELRWTDGGIRSQLERCVSSAFWASTRRDMLDGLKKLLDVPLIDVFVGGWKKCEEILQYRDAARFPPDHVAEVNLWERTISSVHRPALVVTLDHRELPPIEFEVNLSLTLQTCLLKIQAGRIREIRPGRATVDGSIGLLHGAIVKSLPSKALELPGVYAPAGGIPLG